MISETLNKKLSEAMEECIKRAIKSICIRNELNIEEEWSKVKEELCLSVSVIEGKSVSEVKNVKKGVKKVSASASASVLKIEGKKVPIPFNGTIMEDCCRAITKNNGLYTQCENVKKDGRDYCSKCEKKMEEKGEEIPELGRIEERMECEVMDFVCRNGDKPKRYMEILKKQKLSKEAVMSEAEKANIKILDVHWEEDVGVGRVS